ncbi:putative FAD-linked oxidoreductase YgcU [Trichinella spiralis]|uniref:FAD-linked oxidoreductase YgcU n=1 Tax=Trichinella spiralis TaxID=6334 RepID=A0ABR3KXG5_TRISP
MLNEAPADGVPQLSWLSERLLVLAGKWKLWSEGLLVCLRRRHVVALHFKTANYERVSFSVGSPINRAVDSWHNNTAYVVNGNGDACKEEEEIVRSQNALRKTFAWETLRLGTWPGTTQLAI